MNKLVSVILPVCNGEKYVGHAVESVLSQTYRNIELIVVDASCDSTPQIVRSYSDERIRYFRQISVGSINGYNEALNDYVGGTYVTFIHHDDVYHPEKIYEQVRMMEKLRDVDCVYSDVEVVDTDLKMIRIRGHEDFYHRNDDLFVVMPIGYGICNLGMNVLFKRDFLERENMRYSAEYPVVCDHEYIFQALDKGCVFKHVPLPLLRYRVHDSNGSADRLMVDKEDVALYSRYSMREFEEKLSKSNYSQQEREIILGKLYYRLGHLDEAALHYSKLLDNPWALFYFALGAYRFQNDYATALARFEAVLTQLPSRVEVLNNIGCCHYMLGKYKEAKVAFEMALRIKRTVDTAYNMENISSKHPFLPRMCDRELVLYNEE